MKKINKKGFTLTELIVVIAVIAILAAVLIPTLTGYIEKARVSADNQEVAVLNKLLLDAEINEVEFKDVTELKKYLAEEMDYDGDYTLGVKGSYLFYDKEKYEFVIVATGKQIENKLNIEGEEYLTGYKRFLSNNNNNHKNVAIIGGGNVAVDCALIAKNSNNSVTIFVRRNFYDMKIDEEHLQKLFNKKINIVSNFILTNVYKDEKLHLEGKLFDRSYIGLNNYDVIVKAIGSMQEDIKINNDSIICIPTSKYVVDTIVNTINTINNYTYIC